MKAHTLFEDWQLFTSFLSKAPELLTFFQHVAAMRPGGPERKNEVKCWRRGENGLRASTCPPLTLFYICPAASFFFPSQLTALYNPWDQLISYTSPHPWHIVLLPRVMSFPALHQSFFELTVKYTGNQEGWGGLSKYEKLVIKEDLATLDVRMLALIEPC